MKQYKIIKPYQLTTNDEKILELPIGIILEVDNGFILPKILENNPEYFEEVKDPSKDFTDLKKENESLKEELAKTWKKYSDCKAESHSYRWKTEEEYHNEFNNGLDAITLARIGVQHETGNVMYKNVLNDKCYFLLELTSQEIIKEQSHIRLSDSERKIIETIRTALEGGVQKIDRIIFTKHGIVVTGYPPLDDKFQGDTNEC